MTLEITLSSTALSVPIGFLLPKVHPPVGSAPPPYLPMSTVVVAAKLQEPFQRKRACHQSKHWSKRMTQGARTRIRHRTRATLSGNQHFATCSRFPRLKTWGLQSNSCHQVLIYHITVALCQYLNPSISLHCHKGSIAFKSQVQYLSPIINIKALHLQCAAGFYINTIPAQMIMARNAACTTYNFWP